MAELSRGAQIAGYRIEELIGRGGMSRVYRAEQLALQRRVALKVLTADASDNPAFRERFLRESRLAASIEHPNILPVYDAGEIDGQLYLATRLVEGTDLRSVLSAQGAQTPARALSILTQTAGALDAAHARGLIHRDVKPANLLLAGEHIYLTDFGVAKLVDDSQQLTRIGLFVGTIDYASPEQIRNEPLDGRSDLYSLACVFYLCLTGHLPFDRPTEHAVIQAHLSAPPTPARSVRPDLPAAIESFFTIALAKDRADRYRTGGHLVEAARGAVEVRGAVTDRPTVIEAFATPRESSEAISIGHWRAAEDTKSSADPESALREQATRPAAVTSSQPRAATVRSEGSPWPTSMRARVVAFVVAADCLALISYALVEFQAGNLLSRSASGTSIATQLQTLVPVESFLTGLLGIAFWVTAIAWWVWLYDAVRRARDLGCKLSHSPVWSVLTWFIPLVFLVTGYRSVRQLFNLPGITGARIVALWWVLFLGGNIVSRTTANAMSAALRADAVGALLPWEIIGAALLAVSGVLAIWIVARVDRGLLEATRHGHMPVGQPAVQVPSPIVNPVVATNTAASLVEARSMAAPTGAALGGRARWAIAAVALIVVATGVTLFSGLWSLTPPTTSQSTPQAQSTSRSSTFVEADARALGFATYRVAAGESLLSIANVAQVTLVDLINANMKYYPDIARATPPVGSLLVIPRSVFSIPGPTPTPGPTHPYPVTLRAEQMIMPPSEFPLSGYTTGPDQALPLSLGSRWNREFDSSSGQYFSAQFIVSVYTSGARASDIIASTECSSLFDWSSRSVRPVRYIDEAAEVVGDGAKACRFDMGPTVGDIVSYVTGTRNVTITVSVAIRTVGISQAIATCVQLAKQQLGIIERVAPR